MQKTGYVIDGSGYIQGPMHGGQYHVSGGFIYGSSGEVVCKVDGGGYICKSNGQQTGFQIRGNEIWGSSNELPWL